MLDMTKDRVRKAAVRTSSTDNYARAARLHTASTAQLHLDLARAFRDAGWPVKVEHNLLGGGTCTLFPGPTHVQISRGFSSDPAFDPDDPDQADLSEPIEVSCTAPPAPGLDQPE